MFKLFRVVFEINVVICLIPKALQYELKNNRTDERFPATSTKEADLKAIRQNLIDKLVTVENEPIYDYKDMWWKTLNDAQSTKPSIRQYDVLSVSERTEPTEIVTKPKTTITVTTKNNKIEEKRANDLKTADKEKKDAFGHVKALSLSSINADIKKPTLPKINLNENTKRKDLEDYLDRVMVKNQDVLKKNDSLEVNKDLVLPITNDTKVMEKIQKAELDNMLKVLNESESVMNDIPGINASQILDYYNFTAKYFGDGKAGLRQGSPIYPVTKKTERLLQKSQTSASRTYPPSRVPYKFKAGLNTAVVEEETTVKEFTHTYISPRPLPHIITMKRSSSYTRTTDFVTSLKLYKRNQKEGYFSTFLTKLFEIISEKPDSDVEMLTKSLIKEFISLKNDEYIYDFGPELVKILENLTVSVGKSEVEYTKDYAKLLYTLLPDRKNAIAFGVASIIDYIDTLFNDQEGTELFKALALVDEYPNTTENVFEVLRKVSKAMFAPYIRHSGTMKATMLIEAINDEIKRAQSRSGSGDINMGDNKRRGLLTNKTRFAVVRREPIGKETVKSTTKSFIDDIRYNTVNFYEIKDQKSNKRPKDNLFTTEYNPYKSNGRFKIVSRSTGTPSSYKQLKSEATTKTRPSYFKKRYSKKNNTMNTEKKVVHHKNIIKEARPHIVVKHDNISRYKTPNGTTIKKRITGRTLRFNPIKIKYTTTEKYRKYPKIKTKWTSKAIITENKRTTAKKAANKMFKGPIKKVIIIQNFPSQKSGKWYVNVTPKIEGPQFTLDDFAFKAHKKIGKIKNKYKFKQINVNITALKKIKEDSSYSDEEETLKFNLNDALKHDARYYQVARKSNVNLDLKHPLDAFSSYSNEEAAIKSKIYNLIGFSHTRYGNFSDIVQRAEKSTTVRKML